MIYHLNAMEIRARLAASLMQELGITGDCTARIAEEIELVGGKLKLTGMDFEFGDTNTREAARTSDISDSVTK